MDFWKHGKYVDSWSIVHFLWGIILAAALYRFGVEFIFALIISLVLLITWELIEWFINVIEPRANVLVDLAIGIAGFLVGGYFYYERYRAFDPNIFAAIFFLTLALDLWGFIDFLKRGYR